jgi:hypothetical protein
MLIFDNSGVCTPDGCICVKYADLTTKVCAPIVSDALLISGSLPMFSHSVSSYLLPLATFIALMCGGVVI